MCSHRLRSSWRPVRVGAGSAMLFLFVFTAGPVACWSQTPTGLDLLGRGVNYGNMLEAPNEGDWGLYVQEEYFDLVKEAGFDFVRLPVRWNAHAEALARYAIDPKFFARVDEVVEWALERNLNIIVDFHHYEEMASDPRGHKDRFLGIWKQSLIIMKFASAHRLRSLRQRRWG